MTWTKQRKDLRTLLEETFEILILLQSGLFPTFTSVAGIDGYANRSPTSR